MPREARFLRNGACYYLSSKGFSGRTLFHGKEDYGKCLQFLKKYKHRFGISLYGYCLLPDEMHLVVHPPDPGRIALFMQGVKQSYAIYRNMNARRHGKIWGQRFQSQLICDMDQLVERIKAIEFLPVLTDLARDPVNYEWSSCSQRVMGFNKVVDNMPPKVLNLKKLILNREKR